MEYQIEVTADDMGAAALKLQVAPDDLEHVICDAQHAVCGVEILSQTEVMVLVAGIAAGETATLSYSAPEGVCVVTEDSEEPQPVEPVVEEDPVEHEEVEVEGDESEGAGVEDDTDLETLTRSELDARAVELGVEEPEKLPNKDAVIEAILDAESE